MCAYDVEVTQHLMFDMIFGEITKESQIRMILVFHPIKQAHMNGVTAK